MKKLLVLAGLTLLMASNAMAQLDPDPNGLGVFFSNTLPNRCESAMPGMKSMYLVATNISQTGIAGWECKVYCSNPMWMFLNVVYGGLGPINILTPPDFQVGLGVPMETTPFMVLATLNYFVQDMNAAYFRIGACSIPSTADAVPVYADAADVGNLIAFVSPQADWTLPVAMANVVCSITDVQENTWGGVKGLFK